MYGHYSTFDKGREEQQTYHEPPERFFTAAREFRRFS
jgi:hypothetical protein